MIRKSNERYRKKLDKDYVLHTYARNYVNFKKGVNATLYDDENKDYIDFTSGIGVTSVGHGNARVAKEFLNKFQILLILQICMQ